MHEFVCQAVFFLSIDDIIKLHLLCSLSIIGFAGNLKTKIRLDIFSPNPLDAATWRGSFHGGRSELRRCLCDAFLGRNEADAVIDLWAIFEILIQARGLIKLNRTNVVFF